ncbi:MerR family transcriptional regulator [Agreia sp. Leaf283]|uniref:MerR family transcriptional regulator n=1 Tax=Agreia sp. Leaf283 TaxID=1736321 RepID=UPI0009E84A5C|nr:MerR family transcriptional regulator [Agreia sp. Leaf283]
MLGIGEFAGLTGLSVKALRHYDEKNVLVPADIDERSAYRRYSEAQVRAGVVIQALRGAGVPLPAVSDAIASGGAERVLVDHRRRVLEQRESEDQAYSTAAGVLRALAVPVNVSERTMPAQPFLGQAIIVSVDDVDAVSNEDANQVFSALFAQLHGSGLGPSGQFWTALRAGDRGTVELVCCWPTFSSVPESACGPESFSGMLPSRTELVATWRPVEGEELPDGSLHPAIVGLFDSIADRDLSLGDVEVRQTVLGQSEDDYTVEVSITVSR